MAAERNDNRKKNVAAGTENASTTEKAYSKAQLQASRKFANRRDLLETLLEDGRQYSVPTVERMIKEFMKGEVK